MHNEVASEASMPQIEIAELLPLDARERGVSYRVGGKMYRHVFRPLKEEDWAAFFSHIIAEFRQKSDGFEQVVDTDYASLVLYGRAIRSVEGFRTKDGTKPEELPGWPECIPQDHRSLAVDVLMKISRSAADADLVSAGKSVWLDAVWNEAAPGSMKQYQGLAHHFSLPTAEHRRRYLRAKNRAFVAGGSRNGTTLLPSAHPVMLRLYDELIESVEGYGVSGRPLDGREEIRREMDALHKSAAVAELFPTALRPDREETEAQAE